ncbi:helix-turn-helix domain-containing protein [Rhodopila sp.]|uniref:helix-turn-helix transcriptional regulator n=1 Tax=Rhodopila sp. TaxID=2480087 RepID=UPI003D1341F2
MHWGRACCPEFEVVVATQLGDLRSQEPAGAPVAIVLHASGHRRDFEWIEQQIEAKNRYCASAPTILIVDAFNADLVQNLIVRGAIDAFIPMSDTTEVAAAALRLVIAGGRYMPLQVPTAALPSKSPDDPADQNPIARLNGLTQRERAVLDLLKTGKPNKVIAHQLSMSLSTAKVHVHNIIRKLKVKNRTEAVIAATKISVESRDQSVHPADKVGHLEFELAAKKGDLEITPHLASRFVVRAPRVGPKAH